MSLLWALGSSRAVRVEIAVLRRCTWQGDLRQTMAAMTTGSGTSLVPGVRRPSWLMGGGSAVECGPAKGILGREMEGATCGLGLL